MTDSCDLTDCSLPGSSVHGIFQARKPEWVSFSIKEGSGTLNARLTYLCPQYQFIWTTFNWNKLQKHAKINWMHFLAFHFVLGYSRLTNNVVIVSQQVNSEGTQPYIYMHPFFPKPFSHPGCHITLSRVLWMHF